MNILIEGWRGINHSYCLVNQWQILELIKSTNIFFKDTPFVSENWNSTDNSDGLKSKTKETINKIPCINSNQPVDVTYRISSPCNFDKNFHSKLLVIFATCEYKYLDKINYKNGNPNDINQNDKILLHTPSLWSKEGLINSGFDHNKILVIPHGVNKDYFNVVSFKEREILRNKKMIDKDSIVLTNIGAMTENKGIEMLISAYGILKKKYKNLKLILKDQSNLYGINTDNIFKKIQSSKFNEKFKIINKEMLDDITLISKNLSLDELRNLYLISDCYVSPYLAEGFNLTPLEAAACGTKIIVTKGGSTDDYFNDCLGYQIESSQSKISNQAYRLEPKIDSLISIMEEKVINKKDNLRYNRSEYVHHNFSWEKATNKLKKEFENVLNQ